MNKAITFFAVLFLIQNATFSSNNPKKQTPVSFASKVRSWSNKHKFSIGIATGTAALLSSAFLLTTKPTSDRPTLPPQMYPSLERTDPKLTEMSTPRAIFGLTGKTVGTYCGTKLLSFPVVLTALILIQQDTLRHNSPKRDVFNFARAGFSVFLYRAIAIGSACYAATYWAQPERDVLYERFLKDLLPAN